MNQTNRRPYYRTTSLLTYFLHKSISWIPSTFILLLTLFVGINEVTGQVIINPHAITGFQFSSKDMLNFDVINPTKTTVMVQYTASMQDASGRMVVRYISKKLPLTSGGTTYNPSNFVIDQVQYLNKTIGQIEQTSKFLPSGEYSYCIDVQCVDNEASCMEVFHSEDGYQACSDAHAEPTTPLLLSTPEDEAILKEKRPNFSWIPPMPLGNNPDMRYTFSLVKMREDQTAEDAIRRNRPLYKKESIPGLTMIYPNQLEDLEEGIHYAWQVSAYIGTLHIATSDVWEFEVEKPKQLNQYHRMQSSLTGYLIKQKIDEPLYLSFSADYKIDASSPISVTFISTTKEITITETDQQNIIKRGSSTLILDMEHLGFKPNEVLSVKVTDSKNNNQFVKVLLLPINE